MDQTLIIEEKLAALVQNQDPEESHLLDSFRFLSLLVELLTQNEAIGFTTLFSRLAYLTVKKEIKGQLVTDIHYFRKRVEEKSYSRAEVDQLYKLSVYLNTKLATKLISTDTKFSIARPVGINNTFSRSQLYKKVLRGLAVSYDPEQRVLLFISDTQSDVQQEVRILDSSLSQHIIAVSKYIGFPVLANLVDVIDNEDGYMTTKSIVLMPDLLVGVTSISECFQSTGYTSLKYLARKLIPIDNSGPMMIGNIVNHYLDVLIHNPEISFDDIITQTFQIAPIYFAALEDEDLRELIEKLKLHFGNLKKVVKADLAKAKISKEETYLEPSFLSNNYGLQGRLDLYHQNLKTKQSDIIELKSGKLFKANAYGLNTNHYVQTLLYDLIIESVYHNKVKTNNYILYSYLDNQSLKYAPKVRNQQLDALKVRNEIIAIEKILCDLSNDQCQKFLDYLDPQKINNQFTFLKRDATKIYQVLSLLSDLEKTYYLEYISLISREFLMSKIGQHGIHKTNGFASLWLDPLSEKIDLFTILSYLKISDLKCDNADPIIRLLYTDSSNRLSRFREGDIGIFYPEDKNHDSPLRNQVFKCTIIEINKGGVTIRLRARQKNLNIFRQFDHWHIEGDVLDGGFNRQLHGLFYFAKAREDYRSLILGQRTPKKPVNQIDYNHPDLTSEQNEIIKAAIAAPEYYLLWGPPGTGKTSVIINKLADYYYNCTKANILFLAYTNRAVDEICTAIKKPTDNQFIRIGSRYSVHPDYKDHLLSIKTGKISKRKELLEMFDRHRVFVSTVSSFQGKTDLQKIKKFDLVIIDEASQLLEPMLVGLLSEFRKFILIGDHKQLPAITAQPSHQKKVASDLLSESLGITDLSTSLFERLYRQCKAKGWTWSIGALTNQGRMHQDILRFVSDTFYNSELNVLHHVARLQSSFTGKSIDTLQKQLMEKRVIFIDTPLSNNPLYKTNDVEAERLVRLVHVWKDIYNQNNWEIHENSFGVITPFRSQIALIKNKLEKDKELSELVTVDTIERYQGGSRDHVFISLAVNQASMLSSISNYSDEGIDRKLNVALSRAKEHVIILGAKEVLEQEAVYASLIEYAYNLNLEDI